MKDARVGEQMAVVLYYRCEWCCIVGAIGIVMVYCGREWYCGIVILWYCGIDLFAAIVDVQCELASMMMSVSSKSESKRASSNVCVFGGVEVEAVFCVLWDAIKVTVYCTVDRVV